MRKTSYHVYVESTTGTRKVFSGDEFECHEFAAKCRTTERRKSTLEVLVRCGYSRRPVFEMSQAYLDGGTAKKRANTVCPTILTAPHTRATQVSEDSAAFAQAVVAASQKRIEELGKLG